MKKKRGGGLQFESAISWFILASALDVFMTWYILRNSAAGHTREMMVESNPVARFVISRWGIQGMVYFKFSMVAVVVVIAEIVGRSRPGIARLLLTCGTLVVLGVVIYSFLLLQRNS